MGAYHDVSGRKGGGKGGGGSGRVAQEDPNTLRSNSVARIIDILGEGPMVGLVDGPRSVLFDETPLQAADGSWNFSGVNYQTRTGLPDQDHVAGFPSVENETEVSAQVTQAAPLIRTISDADTDAVRVTVQIPALTEQDKKTGDLRGSSVELAIDVRPSGGSWSTRKTDTIKGKTTSPYQRAYRVELDGAAPWDIRVRRLSADNDDDSAVRNESYWSSYTTIIDAKLIYPDTALVALEVDAQQFGNSIPSRAYRVRGRIMSVPDNYDPVTRTYTGIWSGGFKQAWTDNPAWIFYDLATSERFGARLGNVDKWALYEIGRYCDELVPNGYGADEPRFTINTVISSREEAYKVLTTLAAAFRGMMYWGSGTVTVVQDAPEIGDGGRIFSQADTQDGEFRYSGSSLKSRHTVALVTWNDPADNFRQSIEVVEDPAGIQQYGWRQTDVTAFGCTSRGQARRVGLWLLYTEREETETVEFTVGLEHADIRPGEIVRISDRYKAGARLAGRLTGVGQDVVTLDQRPDEASGSGWQLSVQLPSGRVETRDVQGFAGDQLTLAASLSETPMPYAMWMLASQNIQPRRFRVLGVKEDADTLLYTVTALEHNPNKFTLIEQGLVLPERPTSLVPTGRLSPPLDINIESFTYLAGGASHQGLLIGWVKSSDPRTQYYIVNILPPGEQVWQDIGSTDQTSIEYRNAATGEYQVRVRAVDGVGRLSAWSVRVTTVSSLLAPVPPTTVDVETANRSVTLIPRSSRDGQLYEFRRALTALSGDSEIETNAVDLGQATQLADTSLKPGTQYYYWVRGVNAYGVSVWYPVQAKTKADFGPEFAAIKDDIEGEGTLYDAIVGGVSPGVVEQVSGQIVEEADKAVAPFREELDATTETIGKLEHADQEQTIKMLLLKASGEASASTLRVEQIVRAGLAQQVTTLQVGQTSLVQRMTVSEDKQQAFAELAEELQAGQATAENRLTTVETNQGSQATLITNLKTGQTQANARLSAVETTQGSQATLINQVKTAQANVQDEFYAMWDPATESFTSTALRVVNVGGKKAVLGMRSNGQVAEIGAVADRFYIYNEVSGQMVLAFVVQGGRVVIPEALIGTVKFSKLVSETGEVLIENGKIKAKFLTVDNARSPNYQAGTAGWSINADGSAELNNVVIRGRLDGATGTFAGTLSAQSVNAVDSVNIRDGAVSVSSSKVYPDEKSMPHGNNGTNSWGTVISDSIDPVGKSVSVKTAFMYRLFASGSTYARASMLLRITVNGQEVYRWARAYGRIYDYTAGGDGTGASVDVTDYAHLPMVISGWNGSRTVAIEAAGDFNASDLSNSRDFTVSERFIELTTLKK